MADTGILPRFLGHRNVYGAPTFGVLLSASGVICLGWLSFSEVVDMLNLLFCYGQAIEFVAFLWLRWAHPDMHRPYTVPIGFAGMCVMLFFPMVFIGVIVAFSSRQALVVSSTLAVLGVFVYYVLEFSRAVQLCAFNAKEEIEWIEMQSVDPFDHEGGGARKGGNRGTEGGGEGEGAERERHDSVSSGISWEEKRGSSSLS